MFGKLKEKLKNWAKTLAKDKEEKKVIEEKPKKEIKKKEKKTSTKKKVKQEKKPKEKKETQEKERIIEVPLKVEYPLIVPDKEFAEREINKIQQKEPETKTQQKKQEVKQENTKITEENIELEEKSTEEQKPKEKQGEKRSFFSKLTSSITKTQITQEDFENYSEELQMLLLENNVAYEVAEQIIEKLKEKIINKEIPKKEIESSINKALEEVIREILIPGFDLVEKIKSKKTPFVILFCGINGSGKTTTIAKIANMLQKEKLSCVLAAGDTFRAAAIDQIKKHGEKLKIPIIANDYGSDPASVGFDAVKYAEKHKTDVVLIDTAGRMHTSSNLMKEIEKMARVCKPDLKIFVGEAITGNDATEQVKAFNNAIGIDGIILSKADIDEKAGTVLSVGKTTEKPILYLGTGQEYKDIEKFDKKKFIEKLGLS